MTVDTCSNSGTPFWPPENCAAKWALDTSRFLFIVPYDTLTGMLAGVSRECRIFAHKNRDRSAQMNLIDIAAGSPVWLAAMAVTLSAASGTVASSLLHKSRLRSEGAPRHAFLLGMQVGLSIAALASALVVLSLVARVLGAKTASEDIGLRAKAWHSAFALAAALLSTVPAGATGEILDLP